MRKLLSPLAQVMFSWVSAAPGAGLVNFLMMRSPWKSEMLFIDVRDAPSMLVEGAWKLTLHFRAPLSAGVTVRSAIAAGALTEAARTTSMSSMKML